METNSSTESIPTTPAAETQPDPQAQSSQTPTSGEQSLLNRLRPSTDGRPEWCPEDLWDKELGKVKDESLYKAFRDTKSAFNKLQEQVKNGTAEDVPDKSYFDDAEYDAEGALTIEGVENFRVAKDDPVLNTFMKACMENRIGKERFKKIFAPVINEMAKLMQPAPVDIEAELSRLDEGTPGRGATLGKALDNWFGFLQATGQFNKDEFARLTNYVRNAEDVMIMSKLMNLTGQKSIPVGPSLSSSGNVSLQDWKDAVIKPQYKTDPAYREKWDKIGQEFFPG